MELIEKYKVVEERWNEIGFLSESSKILSAESPSIPFSKHDKKHIRIFICKNPKYSTECVQYVRVSHVFQWANEILEEWGYKCIERDKLDYNPGILDINYYWQNDNPYLSSLTICNNFCHRERFRIGGIYGYGDDYFKVEVKEDIQQKILNCIEWMVNKSQNKQLIRQLNIKKILN